jgi:choline dehydrogenase
VTAHIFDYVIVGAGSAGCVLASRLSENPRVRVCLIEAGPADDSWLIRTPAAVGALMNHKVYNWGYRTTPQKHLHNREINLPRGRVVGGCSSINGMVYFRGHPRDFDEWAAAGNPGWSYSDVLPYFLRSECNRTWKQSELHGNAGPMTVSDIPRVNPLVHCFIDAAKSLGYRSCSDFNGGDPEGFGTRQATIRNGRRESMATAYLHRLGKRDNLCLLTDTLVDKVLFEGRRALGVQAIRDGESIAITASREVVLCGGAFASPAILLRSGIGDADELQRLGIEVRQDLRAVGRHLQDHLVAPLQMQTDNTDSYGLSLRALPRALYNVAEYALFRRGPLASNVFEATGFIRTRPDVDRPDVQLIFMPAHRNPSGFPIPLGHGYGILTALLRPASRGRVFIESADPARPPLIDPNFLGEQEDLDVILRGMKIARQLLRAPAFARYRSAELLPGDSVLDDDGLCQHIRSTAATVHHPSGTCRMGTGRECVVDPELRVHGVANLRVVDASVFPQLLSGNINAAVVMVAEKAADLIGNRV